MHPEELVFGQETRDVAVRVFDIAEMQGAGDTGVNAGWRRLRILTRRQPPCNTVVDPVNAKCAFG